MEPLHQVLEIIVVCVDVVSIIALLFGFGLALVCLFRETLLEKMAINKAIMNARFRMGGFILFALELMIVSDLVHTILSPTLDELYYLALLVVTRTVISFFLGREIKELEE